MMHPISLGGSEDQDTNGHAVADNMVGLDSMAFELTNPLIAASSTLIHPCWVSLLHPLDPFGPIVPRLWTSVFLAAPGCPSLHLALPSVFTQLPRSNHISSGSNDATPGRLFSHILLFAP